MRFTPADEVRRRQQRSPRVYNREPVVLVHPELRIRRTSRFIRTVNRIGWWLQGVPSWGTQWGMGRVEARGKTRRHPDGFIFRPKVYRLGARLCNWEFNNTQAALAEAHTNEVTAR